MKRAAIVWLPEELAWIEARKDWPRARLYSAFCFWFKRTDISLSALKSLCKRKGWLTGRTGCFAKGQAPANKGKKMPFNAGSAKTQFKKGQKPHTFRGAGHESVDPEDGYVWLIVDETNPHTGAPTRRVMKHRWLWEQANGPVPEGHRLKCLDGNRQNTDPANWEAIPTGLSPRLNGKFGRGYDAAPAELKPIIMATAKLAHAVSLRRKGRQAQE